MMVTAMIGCSGEYPEEGYRTHSKVMETIVVGNKSECASIVLTIVCYGGGRCDRHVTSNHVECPK